MKLKKIREVPKTSQTEIENMSPKNLVEYSFVYFKCFIIHRLGDWNRNYTLSLF